MAVDIEEPPRIAMADDASKKQPRRRRRRPPPPGLGRSCFLQSLRAKRRSPPGPGHHQDPDACAFFSLSKQKIHTIHLPEIRGKCGCGSFQNGWLMIIDKLEFDIFLFHPWSKKRLEFPHQSTSDFKYHSDIKHIGICSSMKLMTGLQITNAALSDDCKLMVVVVYGFEMFLLAFCRIGDDAWTDIAVPNGLGLVNVIYHNGQFYYITVWGGVYLVHIENDNAYAKRLTEYMKEPSGESYLVPDMLTDTNIMFVILRKRVMRANVYATIHFHIYKFPLGEQGPLDQEKEVVKKFIKVESLGDRVIFLGYNSPIMVMASEFPGLKGNCIYFTNDSPASNANACGDWGVFNVEDGTVEQLFADRFHPAFAPPIWIATPPYSSFQRD